MTDVTSHLNQLNRRIQEKRNLIFSMLEEVITFENKLSIFDQNFKRKTLYRFQNLSKHLRENNSSIDEHYFKNNNLKVMEAFLSRFQEFKTPEQI